MLYAFLLLLLANIVSGQNFRYIGKIEQPKINGWHNIVIPPSVISLAQPQLHDLRLFDAHSKEIPFVLVPQNKINKTNDSILYSEIQKDNFSILIDSINKKTIISFIFKSNVNIDKIIFKIDAPKYFYRNVNIYRTKLNNKKHHPKERKEELRSFVLSSKKKTEFDFLNITSNNFTIEISNDDNQPLSITDIILKQYSTILVADLKKDEKYSLRFGDSLLRGPNYDIAHFVDLKQIMPYLAISQIDTTTQTSIKTESPAQSYWQKPWFTYSALGIGALILFLFSRSLIKDLRKE